MAIECAVVAARYVDVFGPHFLDEPPDRGAVERHFKIFDLLAKVSLHFGGGRQPLSFSMLSMLDDS